MMGLIQFILQVLGISRKPDPRTSKEFQSTLTPAPEARKLPADGTSSEQATTSVAPIAAKVVKQIGKFLSPPKTRSAKVHCLFRRNLQYQSSLVRTSPE